MFWNRVRIGVSIFILVIVAVVMFATPNANNLDENGNVLPETSETPSEVAPAQSVPSDAAPASSDNKFNF